MKKIKLQYYLRGLGVGILVTAIVMGTMMSGQQKELTDAEIKKRAAELGMVDESSLVLSDLQGEPNSVVETQEPQKEESQTEEAHKEDQQTAELQTEELGTEEVLTSEEVQTESVETPEVSEQEEALLTETETATTEETVTEQTEGTVPEEVTVTVTIQSGTDSYSVSKILADAGLVADAKTYDDFLCNMGYSRYIRTGNYAIIVGTSEEEIAKIITGNR